MTKFFSVSIIIFIEKSHEKKEYTLAGLSERGTLVEKPQQRRVEAVFSVLEGEYSFAVEQKYTATYIGVNDFE